jgi:hypothetical protein
MTPTEQAQQLRLAAGIIETEHPFEVCRSRHKEWFKPVPMIATEWMPPEYEIRPVLATPPDGKPLHNPDGLSAEQVGLGYRLALPGDNCNQPFDFWSTSLQSWEAGSPRDGTFGNNATVAFAYRLPLSVPWPEAPKPDPYADLKAARSAGKAIEILIDGQWRVAASPTFEHPIDTYRIKPDAPPFKLPPPPPGMEWHCKHGWKEGDLPQGYRPLVLEEHSTNAAQQRYSDRWVRISDSMIADPLEEPMRTTRPLVFTHEGKQWTWHRPGDPMPCDGEALIEAVYGEHEEDFRKAEDYNWDTRTSVFGWRYAETTKQVPLGPEDVPPGSVFRHNEFKPGVYLSPSLVQINGLCWIRKNMIADGCAPEFMPFHHLLDGWQINRSIPLTGKWDAHAWEPCHKPKPLANG